MNKKICVITFLVIIFFSACKEEKKNQEQDTPKTEEKKVSNITPEPMLPFILPTDLPETRAKAPEIFEAYNKERGSGDGDPQKVIGYFRQLEEIATGDEKIAIQKSLAEDYKYTVDYEIAIKYYNIVAEAAATGHLMGEGYYWGDGKKIPLDQETARTGLREHVFWMMREIFKEKYSFSALLEKEKEVTSYARFSLQYVLAETYRGKGDCNKAIEYYNYVHSAEGINNITTDVLVEVERCQKKLEGKE